MIELVIYDDPRGDEKVEICMLSVIITTDNNDII